LKLFADYAELDAEIKALEAKRVAMKVKIITDMEKKGEEKVVTELGSFTRATRKKYQYSEAVDKLAERLKIAKLKEEQKGVAKAGETHYLVYSPKKD